MTIGSCFMKKYDKYAHSPFAQDPDLNILLESGQDLGINRRFSNHHDSLNDCFGIGSLPGQEALFFPPPRLSDVQRVNYLNGVTHSLPNFISRKTDFTNSKLAGDSFTCNHVSLNELAPVSRDEFICPFRFDDSDKSIDYSRSGSMEFSNDSSRNNSDNVGSHVIKNHRCDACGKLFSRPSSLKTHMYTHTGERPFSCRNKHCGRKFAAASNLRRHLSLCKYRAISVDSMDDGL